MNQQVALTHNTAATRAIYDEYAGMLLGYIYEVVKDKTLAEQYLISVFNVLPQHLHDIVQPGFNTYQRLQLIARKILSGYFEAIPAYATLPGEDKKYLPATPNKYLDKMSELQQFVFCNIHYNGRSINALAVEMNISEEEIKKILQQAFAAIRRAV